jgi:2-polyprenyl-6-methoxyphenol hydroxylase-like FAD-dependent oxidoreductase
MQHIQCIQVSKAIGGQALIDNPVGSNGASQAILDAEALTKAILEHPIDLMKALQTYQEVRLPPTSRIVHANRGDGPDLVMQISEERAPDGFKHIQDVISQEELDKVGQAYRVLAGADIERVNNRAQETQGEAEKLGLKSPVGWVAGKEI